MKKLLCFLLCLTLIFSSFSLCFAADWSASQISSVISDLSTIKTTLSNIYSRLDIIRGALFSNNHSVAYYADAILTWMSPILNAIQQTPLDLDKIYLSLGTTYNDNGSTVYRSHLYYTHSVAEWLSMIYPYMSYMDVLHKSGLEGYNNTLTYPSYSANGVSSMVNNTFNYTNPFMTLLITQRLDQINRSQLFRQLLSGNASLQSLVSFADPDSTVTFTPSSATDGIYKYLNALNTPLSRLGYVLASDSRIEAQDAAAANEQAVVDNFIDSSGDGSASPSDIGSVSDLSSGYKQNFGTDASPSGIFDIFNSDHATWFSQDTKNQLDTTTPSRMTKSSTSETPLLDKQIEDIYDALGVKQP